MLTSQSTPCWRNTSLRVLRIGSSLPDAGLITTWMRRYGASAITALRSLPPPDSSTCTTAGSTCAHCPASRPAVRCFGSHRPRQSCASASSIIGPTRRGGCNEGHPRAMHGRPDPSSGRLAIAALVVAMASIAGCGSPAASPQATSTAQPGAPPRRRPPVTPSATALPTPARARRHSGRRCSSRPATSVAATRPTTMRRARWRRACPASIATLGDTAYEDGTTAGAQRLLRRIVGRRQGPDPVRGHRQPRHPHGRWRAPAGVHGQRGRAGRADLVLGRPRAPGTSSSSTGTAVSSAVAAAAAPTRRRGSATTSRRAAPVHGRAAPPAAVQQRPARGRWRGSDRCGTRCTRAAPTSCSTATTTTTSASPRRTPPARRTPRAASWRSSPAPAVPSSRRSGRRGELAGQDQRHLRGAGAHAPRRLLVVPLRRRRWVGPRPWDRRLPLSPVSRQHRRDGRRIGAGAPRLACVGPVGEFVTR